MMKEYLRTFAKAAIAVFCVWHVAAVGLYSIPGDAKDPVATFLRAHATPRVTPYVLVTSQWQQWNLFAPNPLRRIIFYRVEKQNAVGDWSYVASINDHTYSYWRHSVHFKLLGQAIEENSTKPELVERAAQVLCKEYGIVPGTRMRVWHEVTVVPYVSPPPGVAWWNAWIPQFESNLAIETPCQP